MISIRLINKVLSELREITGADLLLLDGRGKLLSAASDREIPEKPESLGDILPEGVNGPVESGSWHIRRISDEDGTELLIAAAGASGDLAVRVGASEMEALLIAAREKTDKNHFLQSVLTGSVSAATMHREAARLRIREDVRRMLFLAEINEADRETAMQVFRAVLAAARAGGMIIPADARHVAVVYEIHQAGREETMHLAHTLLDTLNAEAMIPARIAVGTPAGSLNDLPRSFADARMALEAGRLFMPGRKVIACDRLGIGRLIWELPVSLCERFLGETFPENALEELDGETMETIRRFFACSLNISETARQLYVHRNTLVYRLEKLEKLTGLDIRKFDDAMSFRIAMMVHERLRQAEE